MMMFSDFTNLGDVTDIADMVWLRAVTLHFQPKIKIKKRIKIAWESKVLKNTYNIISSIHGCLVIARHNKVRDGLLYLDRWSLPPNCVRDKPLIYQGRIRLEEEVCQGRHGLETRCDVLIWGLWESQNVLKKKLHRKIFPRGLEIHWNKPRICLKTKIINRYAQAQ